MRRPVPATYDEALVQSRLLAAWEDVADLVLGAGKLARQDRARQDHLRMLASALALIAADLRDLVVAEGLLDPEQAEPLRYEKALRQALDLCASAHSRYYQRFEKPAFHADAQRDRELEGAGEYVRQSVEVWDEGDRRDVERRERIWQWASRRVWWGA